MQKGKEKFYFKTSTDIQYNVNTKTNQLFSDKPTRVRVGMYIEGMSSLHAQTMVQIKNFFHLSTFIIHQYFKGF